ncbi:CRISPR-associated helicase/endonuclease Cas3 [Micromonospora sp. DH15]|nr:CRISPR-associated helicase/endonuclease Cas3 [Micromonospora sp. DH15]
MPIHTVLGLIAPEQLGPTSMHEHLLSDLRIWSKPPRELPPVGVPMGPQLASYLRWNALSLEENLILHDPDVAAEELAHVRAAGGSAVVELTLEGMGRRVGDLPEIARRAGVHVCVGSGFYVEETMPAHVRAAGVDELTELLVAQLTDGIGDTGIRPALLGEIGTSWPITDAEWRMVRAAGRAGARTGAAVYMHLSFRGAGGVPVLAALLDAEAALAAVEILARRSGAGGCFLALPTRATGDAMFSRVLTWLCRLPDADLGRGARDAALAHGKAMLNDEYSRLYRGVLPSAIALDEGGTQTAVHGWLAGRKRKLLSSFVVGTIDQLLFAALQARHVALRHLGLAGKVVVIDEAHAYDVYMSRYLDRALEWLGAHGVPVVILSATLPAARRADMMRAYDDGRLGRRQAGGARRRYRAGGTAAADDYQPLRDDRRYPLLSVSGVGRQPVAVGCAASGRSLDVRLAPADDDLAALADRLRADLADGGCVLIVRNTVARVLDTAATLREQLGPQIPVSVAHSRFMAADRAAKDKWLRDTFGPPSHLAKLGRARPSCHVVVASQVAEQSLDIDFDLLVTDLAPVDLILQRLGRLHRHHRADRPARLAHPRCLVTGADWTAEPPAPVTGSVRVYDRFALLRAAAVLLPYLDGERGLALPQEIASLVQDAYGAEPVGPPSWQDALAKAETQALKRTFAAGERAETFRIRPVKQPGVSLLSWLDANVGNTDTANGDERRGRAHVRDDAAETLEVLLLVRRGDELRTPSWLAEGGDVTVPTDFAPSKAVARAMLRCALPLPRALTANGGTERIIAELETRNAFPAWEKDPLLGGELILDLDERGQARLADHILTYDRHSGLRVEKADPCGD